MRKKESLMCPVFINDDVWIYTKFLSDIQHWELATVKGKFVFEVSIHIDNSPAEILITRPSKESSLTHNIS